MESFRGTSSWNFFDPILTNRLITMEDWYYNEDDEVDKMMKETVFKKLVESSPHPFSLGVG